ncbi:hypothetical protein CVT24_007384 [Panaeolus cyanescens]|uniref:ABM domain-containing protein n=1 Tax=Panaeolus cyanescens TaxID=181874 RepID=A0A409YL20_9AGAR|nr:hypothetical protein CVT24_007384 [Panaeolus cyanescens]
MSFVESISFTAAPAFLADRSLANATFEKIVALDGVLGLYQGFVEEDPNVFYIAIVWSTPNTKLSDYPDALSGLTSLTATHNQPTHYRTTLNGIIDVSVDAPATEVLSLRLKGGFEYPELDEIMKTMAKDINEGKVEGALVPCVWGPAENLSPSPEEPAGTPFLSFAGWTFSDLHRAFEKQMHGLAGSDPAYGALFMRFITIVEDIKMLHVNYKKFERSISRRAPIKMMAIIEA